jgi:hypothetical protein
MRNAQPSRANRLGKVFVHANFTATLNARHAAGRNFDFGRGRYLDGAIGSSSRLERGKAILVAHEFLDIAIGLPACCTCPEFFLGSHGEPSDQ